MAAANGPTPAANWPIVTMFAGKRTVRHSRSRIGFAIAYGLIACVVPTETLRPQPVVEAFGCAIIIVATEWIIVVAAG